MIGGGWGKGGDVAREGQIGEGGERMEGVVY